MSELRSALTVLSEQYKIPLRHVDAPVKPRSRRGQ